MFYRSTTDLHASPARLIPVSGSSHRQLHVAQTANGGYQPESQSRQRVQRSPYYGTERGAGAHQGNISSYHLPSVRRAETLPTRGPYSSVQTSRLPNDVVSGWEPEKKWHWKNLFGLKMLKADAQKSTTGKQKYYVHDGPLLESSRERPRVLKKVLPKERQLAMASHSSDAATSNYLQHAQYVPTPHLGGSTSNGQTPSLQAPKGDQGEYNAWHGRLSSKQPPSNPPKLPQPYASPVYRQPGPRPPTKTSLCGNTPVPQLEHQLPQRHPKTASARNPVMTPQRPSGTPVGFPLAPLRLQPTNSRQRQATYGRNHENDSRDMYFTIDMISDNIVITPQTSDFV